MFLGRKKRSDDTREVQPMIDQDEEQEKEEVVHSGQRERRDDNGVSDISNNKQNDNGSKEKYKNMMMFKYDDAEHFVVAQEVEALIVDLPETIEESVLADG